jgi:hypothetical protein
MFDSLDKQMAADEKRTMTRSERIWLWTSIVLISALVFGGLYMALQIVA